MPKAPSSLCARVSCVAAVLACAMAAQAAPRVAVWVPSGVDGRDLPRAFNWTEHLVVLEQRALATRFPSSEAATRRAEEESRLDRDLEEAERAFVQTDFASATAALERVLTLVDRLPPSARAHRAYVRAHLLRGRIELASGRTTAAAAAFDEAAQASPELELDEAEYPPEVIAAFQAAKRRAASLPGRTLAVTSEPPGSDVELNGRLLGRTPARLALPPGRCRIVVSRPGFEPAIAPCGDGPALAVRLKAAPEQTLHDQLRERLEGDPRWFVDHALIETLGAVLKVHWILVLERGRSDEIECRLYSLRRREFVPLEPARYGASELRELGVRVRATVAQLDGLQVRVTDPLTAAPIVEAVAGDPDHIVRATVFVRRHGAKDFSPQPLARTAPGRFSGAMVKTAAGPGKALDLEYYVEGYGSDGSQRSRAGDPENPLRLRRRALPLGGSAPAAPPPPAWYTRWYVWVGVAAAIVAGGLGTYFGVRPTDVSIKF